jgi:hypothetical protein
MQQWCHRHVRELISCSRQVEQEQAVIRIVAGLLAWLTLPLATAAHAAAPPRRVGMLNYGGRRKD